LYLGLFITNNSSKSSSHSITLSTGENDVSSFVLQIDNKDVDIVDAVDTKDFIDDDNDGIEDIKENDCGSAVDSGDIVNGDTDML